MKRSIFAKQLLLWHHQENDRALPWKGEKNPYKIWLSEIILQQTRAAQGLPYYLKFIKAYPNVHALAAAPEQEVFKLWEGLGYYSRCRNLIATAKYISQELSGVFPNKYADIIELKGIGPYTAAAIASFAFNEAIPVMDGNVSRILSRYFALSEPIDTTMGKKELQQHLAAVFDAKYPAFFNQAMMDLGATICTPKLAKCDICYLSETCAANLSDTVSLYPIKAKKLIIKNRAFYYTLFIFQDEIFIRQREAKDVWQHLFELYLSESVSETYGLSWLKDVWVKEKKEGVFEYKQKLTHQHILSQFAIVQLNKKPSLQYLNGVWIKPAALKNYAFPKTIVSFLEEMHYF